MTISGPSRDAMLALIREHKANLFDHGIRQDDRMGYLVDAIAESITIEKLEAAGYQVQRHEDVDKTGRERQSEVGQGNRYTRAKPA